MVRSLSEAPVPELKIYATRPLAFAALWAICEEGRWHQSEAGHEEMEYWHGGDGKEEVLRVVLRDNSFNNRFEVSARPVPLTGAGLLSVINHNFKRACTGLGTKTRGAS